MDVGEMEKAAKRRVTTETDSEGEALLSALKAGDEQAAGALVRRHISWMLPVAHRVTHDHALAEDCVQEAFVNVFRNIAEFEGRSSLKSWIYRILVNQALMKLRSRRRRREVSIDELLPGFDENALRIGAPWQRLLTPEDILERQDRKDLVLAKISELPEGHRIVLHLRDIEEMSTKEVADVLGLTEANVKVRLHRARSALKKLIEPVLKGEV